MSQVFQSPSPAYCADNNLDMEGAASHGKATVNRAASVSSATGLMVRNSVELMKHVLSTPPANTQVPPCTPASNAESPAATATLVDRNGSSSSGGGNTTAEGKSRMLNKRQSTTESAVSTSEMLCDSLLAGWDPEREAVDLNGGGVIVENGDEPGQVAKATAMPFSRIATNLEELQKVLPCYLSILNQSKLPF